MASSSPSRYGKPPNWDEDRRPNLYGAVIFFMVLTTVTVTVRLICQVSAHRRLFFDDLFIVLAWILANTLLAVDMFGRPLMPIVPYSDTELTNCNDQA